MSRLVAMMRPVIHVSTATGPPAREQNQAQYHPIFPGPGVPPDHVGEVLDPSRILSTALFSVPGYAPST